MAKQRNRYSSDFKAKVALAAIKGQQTVNEIAAAYSVHPNQVLQWKKQALAALPDTFSNRQARAAEDEEALRAQLYQQIGQLKVEVDWLKKKSWIIHLSRSANWLSHSTSRSVSGDNVSCWG